jgi:hypothetical protein
VYAFCINTTKGTLYHSVIRHVISSCYTKVFGDSSGLVKFNLAFTPRIECVECLDELSIQLSLALKEVKQTSLPQTYVIALFYDLFKSWLKRSVTTWKYHRMSARAFLLYSQIRPFRVFWLRMRSKNVIPQTSDRTPVEGDHGPSPRIQYKTE